MEMNGRPRRAALHQRSDSETNEVRTNPSLHSNNSSVSQKATDVSTWVPHPVSASISRDSTRSSSRTASTNSSRGPSGSIDSLPPVPPLKIYKRESTFIVARDPPIEIKESPSSDTLVGGSNSTPNPTPPKAQTFPKSILKKPSRPALPPCTVEEYNQKSDSWIGSSSQSPTSTEGSRMNSRTLRIVGRSEDGSDEEGEAVDVLGGLINRQRSVSISPGVTPPPQLGGESSAQGTRMFPPQAAPMRSRSDASMERPGTAGSLLASAKQLPAWARYFYSRKGGRGSIIETDILRNGNERVGVGHRVRRQQSDDSMQITEVIPPGAVYHGPRRWASSESVPGLDWVGSRTRIVDSEVATQWSTPHLDHTPLSRFETIDHQLIMFCLGFLLPLCWIIAAFLPLPELHERSKSQPHRVTSESSYNIDVETGSNYTTKQERKYENAKWWRMVNRVMSGVGLVVISVIITLGILAATRGI